MAKISKQEGPSDLAQPGEPLWLQQAEVIPGSQPEQANIATTAAVLADADDERADEIVVGGDPATVEAAQEVAAGSEEVDGPEGDSDSDDDLSFVDLDDEDEDDDDADDLPPADDQDAAVVEDPEVDEEVGPTTTTVEYDPSLYTVDEVNGYLAERAEDGDNEEVERVLAVERSDAGKQRAGVLNRWP